MSDPRATTIEERPRLGRVIEWLVSLAAGSFSGNIEIKFVRGNVEHVFKNESIRAQDFDTKKQTP